MIVDCRLLIEQRSGRDLGIENWMIRMVGWTMDE